MKIQINFSSLADSFSQNVELRFIKNTDNIFIIFHEKQHKPSDTNPFQIVFPVYLRVISMNNYF